MNSKENNGTVSFVIEEHIGVIAKNQSGWTKELNLVSWNGNPAKLDIRDWAPDKSHMGRGITLFREEGEGLQKLLYQYFRGVRKNSQETVPADSAPAGEVKVEGDRMPAEEELPAPEDPEVPF